MRFRAKLYGTGDQRTVVNEVKQSHQMSDSVENIVSVCLLPKRHDKTALVVTNIPPPHLNKAIAPRWVPLTREGFPQQSRGRINQHPAVLYTFWCLIERACMHKGQSCIHKQKEVYHRPGHRVVPQITVDTKISRTILVQFQFGQQLALWSGCGGYFTSSSDQT